MITISLVMLFDPEATTKVFTRLLPQHVIWKLSKSHDKWYMMIESYVFFLERHATLLGYKYENFRLPHMFWENLNIQYCSIFSRKKPGLNEWLVIHKHT